MSASTIIRNGTIHMGTDTVQGLELYAERTGQDFFVLLHERLAVLSSSTATGVHVAARRLGVSASSLLAFDALE